MVDPQWNIWYWGSKWNLHTVCWSAVGCEWGTTSVYCGITYVCFIPSRFPVFAVEPQYLLQYFLFLSKVSFELHVVHLIKSVQQAVLMNPLAFTNMMHRTTIADQGGHGYHCVLLFNLMVPRLWLHLKISQLPIYSLYSLSGEGQRSGLTLQT